MSQPVIRRASAMQADLHVPVVIVSGTVLRRPTPGVLADYLGLTVGTIPNGGFDLIVSRTGYTGERGYELFVRGQDAGMTSLYRGLDQTALDAGYNNGAAVADSARFIAAWQARSAAFRAARPARLDLAYGDAPRNRLDFSVVRDLTDADLKDLGVVLGDRRKILRAIAGLDATSETAALMPKPPSTLPAVQDSPTAEGSSEQRDVTLYGIAQATEGENPRANYHRLIACAVKELDRSTSRTHPRAAGRALRGGPDRSAREALHRLRHLADGNSVEQARSCP